jgi:hypothetical protein
MGHTDLRNETVRKALEKPATQLSGSPEMGISANFTSQIQHWSVACTPFRTVSPRSTLAIWE